MLDFQQIKDQYPENLQRFERAILREYLQYKVLQAVFESRHASKLAFLGGTALRIVYGNNRFSEDIDLDNSGLSWTEFEEVIQKVKRFMELEGFEAEIRNVAKGAYRCYLRFPALLYEQGLSPWYYGFRGWSTPPTLRIKYLRPTMGRGRSPSSIAGDAQFVCSVPTSPVGNRISNFSTRRYHP